MLVIVTMVCFGHLNPRSAFLDHSWALFRRHLAALSRETGNDEMMDSGHFWLLLALCYQGDVWCFRVF